MRSRSNLPSVSLLCVIAGTAGALVLAQSTGCGGGGATFQSSGSGGSTSTTGTHATSTTGNGGSTSTTGTHTTSTSTTSTTGTNTTSSTTGNGGSSTTTANGGSTTSAGGSGGTATTSTTAASTAASTAAASSSGSPTGCGNGVLDPGEECDDGNTYDLDGCDSSCKYEVVTRMSSLAIATTAGPAFCVHKGNALGSQALNALAVSLILNPALTTDVGNATVNVLTEFLGLTDDTGSNATGFSIGIVDATPDPAKGTWPGNNPTDWWFLAGPGVVNMGLPTGKLTNGKLVNHALTAGPNTVSLTITLSGTPANLTLNNAKIAGTVGNATDTPAGLPASTKLESGLMVLETITANGNNQGLCGDITVASLKAIAVPAALLQGGADACTQNYTAANSLLDVLVVGCNVTSPLPLTAVNPTQPDVAGGAKVTKLTAGTGNVVALPAGDNDAYSAFLQFATTREHFSGQSCTSSAECQETPATPSTPQACTGKVCTPQ